MPPDPKRRKRPGKGTLAVNRSNTRENKQKTDDAQAAARAAAVRGWCRADAGPPTTVREMIDMMVWTFAPFCPDADAPLVQEALAELQAGRPLDPVTAALIPEIFQVTIARSLWGEGIDNPLCLLTGVDEYGEPIFTDLPPHVAHRVPTSGSA